MQTAVAAFAFLEFNEGFEQASAIEVGPQCFADVHFGVGNLPQQEIAYAHFSAGANEQIWIGQAFGVQIARNFILGDALKVAIGNGMRMLFRGVAMYWVSPIRGYVIVALGNCMAARCVAVTAVAGALRENGVHGIDYFGAAAVIERDAQAHAGVSGGLFGSLAHIFLHSHWKLIDAAEKAHADVIALDEGHFFADIFAQQLHEEIGFNFGAAPILNGKSVKRQSFDVQPRASFNRGAGSFGAVAMAGDARKMTALRPAAVAVHDDRHVARHARKIELFEQFGFFHGQGTEGLCSADRRWRDLFCVWHARVVRIPGDFPLPRKVNIRIGGMQTMCRESIGSVSDCAT
jgi:hypothetical protein